MSEPAAAPIPVKTPIVLIVDDDRLAREHLQNILVRHGMNIETVENSQQTLDRISRGGVDLVLLDIVMPGLSGLDCCKLIKSMTQSQDNFVPVILVTHKTDAESRVQGLRIGADDYVCKPFDERELLARVNGMLRIKRIHDDVAVAKARLEELAMRDELTGLYNYRYLHTRLSEEFKRAERYRDPLACAMVDIDHFKAFNDRFGHDVGDQVLAEMASRLTSAVREIDVVARYGGEEFLLVLPSTHFSGALAVADRVWRSIRAVPLRCIGQAQYVTVSVGVALYPSRDVKSKDQLIKAADRALYQAKADGRDRICVFQHTGYIYRPELAGPSDTNS